MYSGGLNNLEREYIKSNHRLRPYQEQNLNPKVHVHVDDYRQHPTQPEGQFG